MQISAAITKNLLGHISVNNDDNWTNKVSTPMLWGAEIMEIPWNTIYVVTNWVYDVLACKFHLSLIFLPQLCP